MKYRLALLLMLSAISFLKTWGQLDTVRLREVNIIDQNQKNHSGFKQIEIDSFAIKSKHFNSLADALQNLSTVYVKNYGPGTIATLSFRGTGANHTEIQWNGININSPMLGLHDLNLIPINSFSNVEVNYGASSLNNTSGGIGGSVNLVSKPDFTNKLTLEYSGIAGSFENYNHQGLVKIGNNKMQSHSYIIRNTALNNFPFRNEFLMGKPIQNQENAKFEQLSFVQDFYFKVNSNNLISLKWWFTESDRQIPAIMLSKHGNEREIDKSNRFLAEWNRQQGRAQIILRSAYLFEEIDWQSPSTNLFEISRANVFRNQFRLNIPINNKMQINSGIDFDFENASTVNYSAKVNRNKSNFFTSLEHQLFKGLNYRLGLRQEFLGEKNAQNQQIDGVISSIFHHYLNNRNLAFLPSFGIDFSPEKFKFISLKGNVSKNYKIPSLNDLYWVPGGNINLKPENGITQEVGMELRVNKKNLNLTYSITYFQLLMNDWIQWSPGSFNYFEAHNVKKVQSKGIESQLNINLKLGQLQLTSNNSLLLNESITKAVAAENDLSLGKMLIYTPNYKISSFNRLEWQQHYLTFHQLWIGKRFVNRDNSLFMPAYQLSTIGLGTKFAIKNLSIQPQFICRNIFNTIYQEIAYRPMPGRVFELMINLKFTK